MTGDQSGLFDLTAPELADCWTPVPLPWRAVQPGDVIAGTDGRLWTVIGLLAGPATVGFRTLSGNTQYDGQAAPDATVRVLVPVLERDALALTREQLAAQVIERRAAA